MISGRTTWNKELDIAVIGRQLLRHFSVAGPSMCEGNFIPCIPFQTSYDVLASGLSSEL
jgi:hypothetical protein